jgi:predicted nucleic acid-binding protein
MKYVIDCSVAFKWFVSESDTDKALRLRNDFQSAVLELLAPDLFPIEIANALLVAERRGRLASGQGAQFLTDVLPLLPLLQPALPDLLPRAYAIAEQTRNSVYDCLYVSLAEHEGCEMVTADDRLIRSLQSQFPFLVALASLP